MAFTVAIDGPAAAGKGTIAREIAVRFGLAYLDTGLLYRATGRRVLDGEAPLVAAKALTPADLAAPGLRTAEVAEAASRVASDAQVRQALVEFQRHFARRDAGAVLDGRDIGTVICPAAEVKLFVTASPEVRARRRHLELSDGTSYEAVLEDVRRRDDRDMGRADAPLRPADDAHHIDTTDLTIEQAVDRAAAIVKAIRAR
ncbi:cytidylate kinase [Palleronia marisminoris]|uniref:Cytidylate kinase n=1 Tax=Palleronia marisminoris TaxID=315423 RepID=A0A1Y5S1Y2_9RHOB|nr:(d)CMP kinase [Palleronia marisminoris]SFG37815.1 cytidylate kinase [Palleronia marisminoris]SLN29820.1 Cytidylate kinase [Palleronia marisminoris]